MSVFQHPDKVTLTPEKEAGREKRDNPPKSFYSLPA
jgi:hypothetical protein